MLMNVTKTRAASLVCDATGYPQPTITVCIVFIARICKAPNTTFKRNSNYAGRANK